MSTSAGLVTPAGQLLFERTIPGFEPSPSSYAFAQEFLAFNTDLLVAAGVTSPADVDIFTALVGGLFTQQQTNEPGGDRWIRHLDAVLEMFFAHVDRRIQPPLPSPPHETAASGPSKPRLDQRQQVRRNPPADAKEPTRERRDCHSDGDYPAHST